jgi:hypothetical protein
VRARGAEVLASAPRLTTTTADPRLLPFPQLRAAARGEAALPVGWRVSRLRTRTGALAPVAGGCAPARARA